MAKKNVFMVDFTLPDDSTHREFLETKSNRISKVYSQINGALLNKYQLMIGDLKQIQVYEVR